MNDPEQEAHRLLCMHEFLAADRRKPGLLRTHSKGVGDLCRGTITAAQLLEKVGDDLLRH